MEAILHRLSAGANGIGDEGGWPAALNYLQTSACW
jgi:hypothetical protein